MIAAWHRISGKPNFRERETMITKPTPTSPVPMDTDTTFTLSDGRKLGYQVIGPPDGRALFLFHGTPGCRLCLSPDDAFTKIKGLRLILPERPGYGLSTDQPGRKITDWASDVSELAVELQLDRFSVSGASGGAPYALACGLEMPDRVNRILLFNSAAPLHGKESRRGMSFGNRIGHWSAEHAPWLLKFMIKISANSFRKNPEANMKALAKQLCAPDAKWMENAEFRAAIQRDFAGAYQNGFSGHLSDANLCQSDWGIDLTQIHQPIDLWHGELDNLSPIQNVRQMVEQFQNCNTRYLPDAGHFLIDLPEVIDEVSALVHEL